jgi:hypothetical protein
MQGLDRPGARSRLFSASQANGHPPATSNKALVTVLEGGRAPPVDAEPRRQRRLGGVACRGPNQDHHRSRGRTALQPIAFSPGAQPGAVDRCAPGADAQRPARRDAVSSSPGRRLVPWRGFGASQRVERPGCGRRRSRRRIVSERGALNHTPVTGPDGRSQPCRGTELRTRDTRFRHRRTPPRGSRPGAAAVPLGPASCARVAPCIGPHRRWHQSAPAPASAPAPHRRRVGSRIRRLVFGGRRWRGGGTGQPGGAPLAPG